MKTWKNRAKKLLIIHNWIFWAASLELPIWPKIDFPYLKLDWGTLCSFYFVVLDYFNFIFEFKGSFSTAQKGPLCQTHKSISFIELFGAIYIYMSASYIEFYESILYSKNRLCTLCTFFLF